MGPVEAGSATKICNQVLTGVTHVLVCEGCSPDSLFHQNRSLFNCVGNVAESLWNWSRVSARNLAMRADSIKFPVLFPVSREFGGGDRFDIDCAHHHASPIEPRISGLWCKRPIYGGIAREAATLSVSVRGDSGNMGGFGCQSLRPQIPFPRCTASFVPLAQSRCWWPALPLCLSEPSRQPSGYSVGAAKALDIILFKEPHLLTFNSRSQETMRSSQEFAGVQYDNRHSRRYVRTRCRDRAQPPAKT